MNEFIIALTRSQVANLVEFFDMAFFKLIADLAKGGEIDNMDYLIDMCEVYTKLSDALRRTNNETD